MKAALAAVAPSPTAEATWRHILERMSPAAKIAGHAGPHLYVGDDAVAVLVDPLGHEIHDRLEADER